MSSLISVASKFNVADVSSLVVKDWLFASGAVFAGVIVILTIAVLLLSVPSLAWYIRNLHH